MKKFINPEGFPEVLSEWDGARVMVWSFRPTFRRLILRLEKEDDKTWYLYIGLIGCVSYCGPLEWDKGRMEVLNVKDDGGGGSNYLVRDIGAAVEIRTSSIVAFLSDKMEFAIDVGFESDSEDG